MWHIGQKVVCIKTHSLGVVQKGQTHTIQGIRKHDCGCSVITLNVGIVNPNHSSTAKMVRCPVCKHVFLKEPSHYWWWIDERLFRPLETTYTEEEIEAVNIDELVCPELETV